jgi:RNase P/RNase MRP subunit POP5
MTCGDLDAIAAKVGEARAACSELGESDLADKLLEAREALLTGDLKTYRKRVETVVAALGHVRSKHGKPLGSPVGT